MKGVFDFKVDQHATGRSFRTLMRAFLSASEKPDLPVFVVSIHQRAAQHLSTRAADMVCRDPSFVMVCRDPSFVYLPERQRINLPNGSYICFLSRENYEIQDRRNLFKGLHDHHILFDDTD